MGQVNATGRLLSGRYRIDAPLGMGGMARVWRGQDLRLHRPVAIKELAGPWLADPTAIQRFDREARIAAHLAHPNIVAVHDLGGHEGSRYLVMELVEGQTVAEMLTAGRMPVDRVVAIAVQTCDGLAAAHVAGVVHRDIKPANLMVTRTGVVKICDFGIAKAVLDNVDTNLTGPMYAMGTSRFMAPEQPDGRIDARTDLYALGCTIYAMLTGDAPFDGSDPAEILQKHRHQVPAPLRQHRADVGAALEALVAELLAKHPDSRPASAAEVKGRLEAAQDDRAIIAPPQQTSAAVTTFMPGVSPVVSPSRRSAHRVARAAVGPMSGRHVRRVVSGSLAAAATLVVVGTVAVVFAFTSRPDSVQANGLRTDGLPTVQAPTVVASGSVTPTETTTASPQSSAPPTPASGSVVPVSSSHPPVDPIATLRLSIQQQVNTGNLNPLKASDLYPKVDGIAQSLNAGNFGDVSHKVQDFRNTLVGLVNGGQLTAAGYTVLSSNLDAIPQA